MQHFGLGALKGVFRGAAIRKVGKSVLWKIPAEAKLTVAGGPACPGWQVAGRAGQSGRPRLAVAKVPLERQEAAQSGATKAQESDGKVINVPVGVYRFGCVSMPAVYKGPDWLLERLISVR